MNTIPRTKVGPGSPLLYRLEGNDGSPWKGWGPVVTTLLPVFSELLLSFWAGCLFSFGSIGLPDYARIFPSYQSYSVVWCVVFSLGWLLLLQSRDSRHLGSVVADHLLSYPKACGSSQPGIEPMSPHLHVDSYLLDHQGSLTLETFNSTDITTLLRICIKFLY